MNNYEEMRIESDVFATARENFDLLMQRLFKSMEKNNSDEGSITLKVDLQMSQDWVPDGKGGSIEINKPVIKHKVSIAVPVKDLHGRWRMLYLERWYQTLQERRCTT